MKMRMWFGAACILLMTAPALHAADSLDRWSGPFKIFVGNDLLGNPIYENCGELKLYRTDASGGREWRLEDTCDQLINVIAPYEPTPTPTPPPVGPTATPRPTGSADCPDGFMPKEGDRHYRLQGLVLQAEREYIYCVDLPTSAALGVGVGTINKANAQCSSLDLDLESPLGEMYSDSGWQPVTGGRFKPGRWRVHLFLNYGCSKYDVDFGY